MPNETKTTEQEEKSSDDNTLVNQVIKPLKETIDEEVGKLKGDIDDSTKDIAEFKEAIKSDIDSFKSKIDEGLEAQKQEYYAEAKKQDYPNFFYKADFKGLWDYCSSVAKAEQNNWNVVDPRITKLQEMANNLKAAGDGLLENTPDVGGVLVPIEFRQEIMSLAEDRSTILSRARTIPMQSTTVEIPYMSGFDQSGGLVHGGVNWDWTTEVEQINKTEPKWGKVQLTLHELKGMAKASNRILSDSPVSLQPILQSAFADGLAFELDSVFLNGTGAGQPLGINNAPAMISITRNTANKIKYEDIVNMFARQWGTNLLWMSNRVETFKELAFMELPVGTGGAPVYLPANQAAGQPFQTLMGSTIEWSKHTENLGTAGDLLNIDWSQYLVGQRSGNAGTKFDTSMHFFFDTNQMAFRFVFEIAGAPWWPSALTGPKSSNTISPFIRLAA